MLDKIPQNIPKTPGVYKFLDKNGNILYVGKAKNLKNRLLSYFQKDKHIRTAHLLQKADKIEYIKLRDELEALEIEYKYIKQYNPPYNIQFRDDKTYPLLCISDDKFPRVYITREKKNNNNLYFGPFVDVGALKTSYEYFKDIFKFRRCINSEFSKQQKLCRPCLYGQINKCLAPCISSSSKTQSAYNANISLLKQFLETTSDSIIKDLQKSVDLERINENHAKADALKYTLNALKTIYNISQRLIYLRDKPKN